ncbi:hypothetical protein Ais01nite_70710 [Asanoa ishikariensis]|uniref:Uncharacterized conserved protein, DUF1330 family n=1 Tax=Asanoa ishikariensis TaxID=137265 RepID=A0A1H3UN23_9ACTN|nr:DUF1330 domain-containing protein [Asanoa ishikariensis]GIF69036.1 hypothetical protein Ais01nite_70710 [Asanoa ishikariensis]SDZ63840.1 Uncharacterized conserved protein, DUF1330 family [Asanoa ishikariensis]
MTAYALAHLKNPTTNADIVDYITRIQDTMDPFGGRFLAHGPKVEVYEGEWPGSVVLLEFPDADAARAWYASPAYREILPLRLAHIDGDTILFDGVPPGYDPRVTAEKLRSQLS